MTDGTSKITDIMPPMVERPAECATHGPYTARVIVFGAGQERGGACPKCAQAKREAEEREVRERIERLATEERYRSFEAAGIPPRMVEKTFDDYIAESPEQIYALKTCRALVEHVRKSPRKAPCMVMAGMPGNGKTALACAMVRDLVGQRTALRRNMADIIDDVRATWGKGAKESTAAVIDRYAGYDLLVIDEVGAGYGSESERAEIFRIIDRRYERMLSTVIVSNLDMAEIKALLGDRVIDRLREDGGKLLGFTGESQRGRKRQ